MRKKLILERHLQQAKSDLIEDCLKYGWSDAHVGYLLGKVVTLEIVLDAELSWSIVYDTIVEQTNDTIKNVQSKNAAQQVVAVDALQPGSQITCAGGVEHKS
jgi:hypothetical protein